MIRILFAAGERALAERAAADLRGAGETVELTPGGTREEIAVLALGETSWTDAALRSAVEAAFDRGQQIVIVTSGAVKLPKLVDHLRVIDYAEPSARQQLTDTIAALRGDETRLPMRVLTPSVRRSNRRAGAVILAVVLFMFAVGIYGIGVLGIQRPTDEFDAVETAAAATRDYLAAPELERYAQFLPASADQAAAVDYLPTLLAVPTVYRPLMALTATAYAANDYQLVTSTPMPPTPEMTPTPGS